MLVMGGMNKLLTICRRIHNDKAGIDIGLLLAMFEDDGIGMTSQSISRLVEMDFMISTFECP